MIQKGTKVYLFIVILQWCEHVCNADWKPPVYRGSVQPSRSASEDGR